MILLESFVAQLAISIIVGVLVLLVCIGVFINTFYKKVSQGEALVRTGGGNTKVSLSGMVVIPVVHRAEYMDISLKRITITRKGTDGLVCKDNLRADITVVFFVRVNPTEEDIATVAQAIGCKRASDHDQLNQLFEAKFSEALKTAGKGFDFQQLYTSRTAFKAEILKIIGEDLNGYALDDCAIDYLEQTSIKDLEEDNILDAEGIKRIRELTAKQITLANKIQREKEKEIRRQDVDAEEAILELNRQLLERKALQKRQIEEVQARQEAEIKEIQEQQEEKAEKARLAKEKALAVEEQNKERDILAAQRNKERSDAVQVELVEQERELQVTERERIVELARIAKEKAIEEEKRNIQDVIRARVAVEREVVEEEEKIKDTKAKAQAEREKSVTIIHAEMIAEEDLVQKIKSAEADKKAAEMIAQKRLIEADAERTAVDKEAEAKKIMADAIATEHAALGLAEAQIMEAKARAKEKEGSVEASILEQKAEAEAKGIEMKGEAEASANEKLGLVSAKLSIEKGLAETQVLEKKGLAEAKVLEEKALAEARSMEAEAIAKQKLGLTEAEIIERKAIAEAKGIEQKAEAMKKLDGVGRDHEEFKLKLDQETKIELAQIRIQKDIAEAQALVLAEALKSANIDIVGGDQTFFDRIIQSVTNGKAFDRLMSNSKNLQDVKENLLNTNDENLLDRLQGLVKKTGITSESVKNMTISALLAKLMNEPSNEGDKGLLQQLLSTAKSLGIADKAASILGIK